MIDEKISGKVKLSATSNVNLLLLCLYKLMFLRVGFIFTEHESICIKIPCRTEHTPAVVRFGWLSS